MPPINSAATSSTVKLPSLPTTPSTHQQYSYWGFIAGVCSGATKLAVGHPFDTIKVRCQIEGGSGRFKGPWHCLVTTIKKEGPLALYKGATPPLLGWALMDSFQMGTLNLLRTFISTNFNKRGEPLSVTQHSLAGLGTGLALPVVATPIELLKGRLQIQYELKASDRQYSGPIDCAKKLIKNNGIIGGLYKGFVPNVMFRSFFWVLWGSFEIYRSLLVEIGLSRETISFVAGGLAANTFWTIAYPFDNIKNRMMTQPDTRPPRFPTVQSCFRHVMAMEGWRGFYRGFVPCFLRSFPTNGAAIFVMDSIMRFSNTAHN